MRTEKENHRATDSDRTFIQGIYQEFCRLMFFTAQKYLSDPLQQEEVVQESLSKLIEKVDTLRTLQPAVLASYIVATVRNTAISLLRAQARQGQVVSLETLDEEPASQESMDEALILQEELAPLRTIWPQLSQEDRLLLETDAPYMAPVPFRGKRCDSTMIAYTAARIAEIRGVSVEELLAATAANARRLFRL